MSRLANTLWKRAGLGMAVALVLLVGVELALRLVGGPPAPQGMGSEHRPAGGAAHDPAYGWRLIPGLRVDDPVRAAWDLRWGHDREDDVDHVNSHGFRDSELADPRPEGQRRVLVLGDSSVYGSGVAAELRFTERLERSFGTGDAASRPVEVINGGVPGWTLPQSLVQLRDSLHLGLDAVVVYSMNSDLMQTERGIPDHLYFDARRRLVGVDAVGRLSMVRWLRHLLRPALPTPGVLRDSTQRVPLGPYRALLEELVALADAHAMGLIFVIPPSAADRDLKGSPYLPAGPADLARLEAELVAVTARPGSEHLKPWYRSAMALVGLRAGVPVVDGPAAMRAALAAAPERYRDDSALFVDAIHPSAEGHAVLADAIRPVLEEVLAATPPWDARRHQVPRSHAPAWLGQPVEVSAAPALAHAAPLPHESAASLVEVSCGPGRAEDGHVRVSLEVAGVPDGASVLATVMTSDLEFAQERLAAICANGTVVLSVPKSLGRVRIAAVVDADNDGPCRRDLAAVTRPFVIGVDAPGDLDLVPANQLGTWGPPFGLPFGAYPLLEHLPQDGEAFMGLGLVVHPSVAEGLPVLRLLDGCRGVFEELGLNAQLADVLDRPQTPLKDYDGLVLVDSLGGDLLARTRSHIEGQADLSVRQLGGWTDPVGRKWTIVSLGHRDGPDFDARTSGHDLLPMGAGRAGAEGTGLLPAALR